MLIQCIIYKCYIITQHKYLRKAPRNNTTTLGATVVPTMGTAGVTQSPATRALLYSNYPQYRVSIKGLLSCSQGPFT
jgi:hypothetical protein